MKEIELSAKELGAMLGVSARMVLNLFERGIVLKAGRGRYSVAESVKNYCEHLRATASGRGGEDGVQNLTAERTRLAREQAEQVALKNAAFRKELVPASEVEREWAEVLRKVRAGCLAVPSRARQVLPHLTGHDVQVIDTEIRAVLASIGSDQ